MVKRRSLESCKRFSDYGYTLYENNKFCIVKHYNKSGRKNYFKEIYDCFMMFFSGIGLIVSFPFILIYTLFSFVPSIYIKDENIDKKEQLEKDETNKKMEELFIK